MKKFLTALAFVSVTGAAPALAQDAPPAAGAAPPPAAGMPAEEGKLPSWLEYKPVYSGEETNIANPHRTRDEITTWAQQTAAEVLSFGRDDYTQKMTSFRKYFVPQGWDLYIGYLKQTRAIEMISAEDYTMGAIVADVPEIVNQGTFNGAYHWILRMPVTISFANKNPDGTAKPGPSGKFYLFMDVLRVPEGGGDAGIAITNWRVMDVPKR